MEKLRNTNTLMTRVVTVAVSAPPALAAIYVGGIYYFVLMLGVLFLCLHEYIMMFETKWKRQSFFLPIYVINSLLVMLAFNNADNLFWREKICVLLVSASALFFMYELKRGNITWRDDMYAQVLRSVFYIGVPVACAILIRTLYLGFYYTMYVVLAVWLNDMYAYLIGKNWGRHKLNEIISPKKTIEGFSAGLLAVLLFNLIIAQGYHFSPLVIVLLSLFIPVFATLGDLTESLLKRNLGVKDSGGLLPGHGGILDRVDSFFMVMPLYFYLLVWFIHP